MNFFEKIIISLENSKAPMSFFILTFLFSVNLRSFVEAFSVKNFEYFNNAMTIIHYNLFYVSLAISLMILFHLITRKNIISIARVVLTSFIVVIIPPIVDLIISQGKGLKVAYLMPGCHDDLLARFFLFFGDLGKCSFGVTMGIKTEIAFVLVASFFYFLINAKKTRILKSMLYTFFVYTVIFFYLAFPSILQVLSLPFQLVNTLTDFFLVLTFTLIVLLSYLSRKEYLKAIVRDMRFLRLSHYIGMFIFGVMISGVEWVKIRPESKIEMILILIALTFAWLYSVMSNNLEDVSIDEISNVDRPLVKNSIPVNRYATISWFVLALSLSYAALVSFKVFFFILVFIGNYFIYSMPPLKIKRIPVLSKLPIALNSLILLILGFSMYNSVQSFPLVFYPLFLVGYTLVLNFIDIKDYEGDKKCGIKTLPTIMGLKKGKFLIGLFFVFIYVSVWFYFRGTFLVNLFLLFGFAQFYFINKKNYNERWVFVIYFISLAFGGYLLLL